MAYKVLVSAPYLQAEVDRFRPLFLENDIEVFMPSVAERLSEEELLPLVGDIDGAICGDDQFTRRVLEAAPRLRVLSKWGTGIDSIDQYACDCRGIVICNTPNAFSEPVADSVLGYMLCVARQLNQMAHGMRIGLWQKVRAVALNELVLGVIGVGNVGKAVIRRATAFGMRVLGNDIVGLPADFVEETGVQVATKEDVLCEADFVSINCDLNRTSYHIVSAPEFERMKPTSWLINTARGPLVNERALVRALDTGVIAGAALDVFEDEPLPIESPLRGMENVMLAPHNANASPAAWERVHRLTIDNLIQALMERER